MKYCTRCGKESADETLVCAGCGCAFDTDGQVPPDNTDTVMKKERITEIIKKYKISFILLLCIIIIIAACSIIYGIVHNTAAENTGGKIAGEEAIDDKAQIQHRLSDFMMTIDEYRKAYIASDLPVTEELINLDLGPYSFIPYSVKSSGDSIMLVDDSNNGKSTVRLMSTFSKGRNLGYDFMMKPIFLYIKNIPGAVTDIQELIDRWNKVQKNHTTKKGESGIESEFTYNGIKYYKYEALGSPYMYIEVTVDKNQKINLADYPDFLSKGKTESQPKKKDLTYTDSPTTSDNDDKNQTEKPIENSTNSSVGGSTSGSTVGTTSGSTGSSQNNKPCANGHNWKAVTKTVHHDEVGHYGTVHTSKKVVKYKCAICYNRFDSLNQYYSHFDESHGSDKSLTLAFRERYEKVDDWEYYDKREWIVDQEAFDETVITGYKCSICGKTK